MVFSMRSRSRGSSSLDIVPPVGRGCAAEHTAPAPRREPRRGAGTQLRAKRRAGRAFERDVVCPRRSPRPCRRARSDGTLPPPEEVAVSIPTRIVVGIAPRDATPARVDREFRALLAGGARLRPAGSTKPRPEQLLTSGYAPKHAVALFDAEFYLTHLREDDNFRFFVAYVRLAARPRDLYPRLFYKDSSLVWRCATHYVRSERENWIGKGDLKPVREDGELVWYSAEETTNLPLEIQAALDEASRSGPHVRRDLRAAGLVLRKGPDDRVAPYADFSAPRRRAMARRGNRIHGGRRVAWFEHRGDPDSLRFAEGFEPDFRDGVLETSFSKSRLYGGEIRKLRILSVNRRIQYQFIAGPQQVWIVPPQALTTELSSYGVRTVDVDVDEDLCVPGYEYHYVDDSEDPPQLVSQIPAGFVGARSDVDPTRADASPWLERLPVIRAFRAAGL
jgi:hypothetical protein